MVVSNYGQVGSPPSPIFFDYFVFGKMPLFWSFIHILSSVVLSLTMSKEIFGHKPSRS